MPSKRNVPSAADFTARRNSTSVTVASPTTAPCELKTVPLMLPLLCAKSVVVKTNEMKSVNALVQFMEKPPGIGTDPWSEIRPREVHATHGRRGPERRQREKRREPDGPCAPVRRRRP